MLARVQDLLHELQHRAFAGPPLAEDADPDAKIRRCVANDVRDGARERTATKNVHLRRGVVASAFLRPAQFRPSSCRECSPEVPQLVDLWARGNIVDVYTTFPWAALCHEVKKLKISLRDGLVLDGDFRGLAAMVRCHPGKCAESLAKECDPNGIRMLGSATHSSYDVAAECRSAQQPPACPAMGASCATR